MWPFVGRESDLGRVTTALRDPAAGALAITGPPGVGKSRLVYEALATLDPSRFVVHSVPATSGNSDVPLGPLGVLVPDGVVGVASRGVLVRAMVAALTAGSRRAVVVVDDAHLLDDESAAVLRHLARTRAAFVLVVLRAGEPFSEWLAALWTEGLAERIEPAALSPSEVGQVLHEVLGGQAAELTVRRLHELTAGNPLLLREVVLAGMQAGTLAETKGVWRWEGPWLVAPRLTELVARRLGALADQERWALELLALAEPVSVGVVTRLVPEDLLTRLEARGLLWIQRDGRRSLLRLAHPLYGEALRDGCPELRTRRAKRVLAEAIAATGARRRSDALRIVRWSLDAGVQPPPGMLLTATRRAWTLLDLPLAEQLARDAALTPEHAEERAALSSVFAAFSGDLRPALSELPPLFRAGMVNNEAEVKARLAHELAGAYGGRPPAPPHDARDPVLAEAVENMPWLPPTTALVQVQGALLACRADLAARLAGREHEAALAHGWEYALMVAAIAMAAYATGGLAVLAPLGDAPWSSCTTMVAAPRVPCREHARAQPRPPVLIGGPPAGTATRPAAASGQPVGEEAQGAVDLEVRHVRVPAGVGVQGLLGRGQGVEQGQGLGPRHPFVVPLQQEPHRDGDPGGGLDRGERGAAQPQDRRADPRLGGHQRDPQGAAQRHAPVTHRPLVAERVQDRPPLRHGLGGQQRVQLGQQRGGVARAGHPLPHRGDDPLVFGASGPVAVGRRVDGRRREAAFGRQPVRASHDARGLLVLPAAVPDEDQAAGFGVLRGPQDAGDVAEGEGSFDDAVGRRPGEKTHARPEPFGMPCAGAP
ncbi:AAA family ATPase [Nonomuraea sp. NPDC050227]|uniref:AAA family ATPase n=1 Tax=Nonomuraea sp. NPDC050227 TaxID=3364360 RepID=UPI0037AE7CAE